jgi:tetratricopeptide (TPR) repeat protein
VPKQNNSFISYTHDSPGHRERVLRLADRLNRDGVSCELDQYHEDDPPEKGWPLWMLDMIDCASYVLAICTKTYEQRFRRYDSTSTGKGAKWEGAAITQELYDSPHGNTKFIPVVFSEGDIQYIPLPLRGTTRYDLSTVTDYQLLYRRLTGQPRTTKPAVGEIRILPPTHSSANQAANLVSDAQKVVDARADQMPLDGESSSATSAAAATSGDIEPGTEPTLDNVATTSAGLSVPVSDNIVLRVFDPPPVMANGSARLTSVKSITDLITAYPWVAIHGDGGSGKTQLAALVANAIGKCRIWLRFRNLTSETAAAVLRSAIEYHARGQNISFSAQCTAACAEMGPKALIVLDDLPRTSSGDILAEHLIALANGCRSTGALLLSTSLHPLPVSARAMIAPYLSEIEAPRFTVDEATGLLRGQGAPDHILKPERVRFLNNIAKEHPLLLAGVSHYLKARGWRFTTEEVNGLFRQEHSALIADEVLPRLMAATEPEVRELLYRVILIRASFSAEDVGALATVPPAVHRPQELLQSLLGFCLQRDGIANFVVSPPIEAIGSMDLGAQTRKGCHRTMAMRILAAGPLDQWAASRTIAHFVAADEFDRAGTILLSGLHSLSRLTRKKRAINGDFLLSFWADASLPEKMNRGLRLYIRGLQISLTDARGQSVDFLLHDFENLLPAVDAKPDLSTFGAFANALPAIGRRNPETAMQLLGRAVDSLPAFNELTKANAGNNTKQFCPEYILWLAPTWINDPDQLRRWMRLVQRLSPEQVVNLGRADNRGESCMSIAVAPWLAESRRKPSEQRWPEVESAFAEAADIAKELHLDLLWANFIRSMVVVRAEYRKDLDGAVRIGETALSRASDDPAVQFVIRECLGRQYCFCQRYREAIHWLKTAIEQATDRYQMSRIYTLIYASISAGQTSADEGTRFAIAAVNVMRGIPKLEFASASAQLEFVKILCECALAQWLSGDLRAAYLTLSEATERLFEQRANNDEWKELFVLVAYAFGYFAPLARSGHPPEKNQFGDEYVAPYRGVFLSERAGRAAFYTPVKASVLRIHLADFAASVGEHEKAVRWAREGLELARADGPSIMVDLLTWYVVGQAIVDGDFDKACELGTTSARFAAVAHARRLQGNLCMEDKYDADSDLHQVDQKFLDDAYRCATIALIVAISCRLATVLLSAPHLLEASLKSALATSRRLASGKIYASVWGSFVSILGPMFDDATSAGEMIRLGNAFDAVEYQPVKIAAYIGASLKQRGEPAEAVRSHLAFFPFVQQFSRSYPGFYRIPLDFAASYWGRQLRDSPFRFTLPKIAQATVAGAQAAPERIRAQTILAAVGNSLGASIYPDAKQWLRCSQATSPDT